MPSYLLHPELLEDFTRIRYILDSFPRAHPNDFGADLAGLCQIATTFQALYLQEIGYEGSWLMAEGVFVITDKDSRHHCWLELDDSMIVDLTATQFGIEEPVFMTSVDDFRYMKDREFTDISSFFGHREKFKTEVIESIDALEALVNEMVRLRRV